ncbi:MAG: N-6 DNA methylase [Eubacteriaceae bacterium]|nr:N-6 DNA methylase [Eubacteriaceae bacterium]
MSLSSNIGEKAALIWAIADKLTGVYKPHEYGEVILPLTVIRRFDCILADTKEVVLNKYDSVKSLPMRDVLLRKASGQAFYNTSKYDFEKLLDDPDNIEANFHDYLSGFSENVQDIIEKFKFDGHITTMANKGILYIVIKEFLSPKANLHPNVISNLEMGYIFEEIIRRFSEAHNEDAGQHYTPREVIELMVNILFYDDNDVLSGNNVAKTIYDPACGTGGMLSVSEEYMHKMNASTELMAFGQEINDQTFAICKADMLIKGNNAEFIKGGNTLSNDQFEGQVFDYIISNPPFGREWRNERVAVEKEAKRGFAGRFGAGLPGVKDGQMLFLMTALSKMKDSTGGGGRVAIIQDGSPLYSGDAESGPSNIRKYIIENDLLEAIIALPTSLFYNTALGTYIWVLSNRKSTRRKGKVQLIDARDLFIRRDKPLGDKKNNITDSQINEITRLYGDFSENPISMVCDNSDFGYYKVVIEHPMTDDAGNPILSKGKPVPDVSLRDTENIAITEDIQEYFNREISPYSPHAWLDKNKIKIGYEIPFTRFFYRFVPPTPSSDILQRLHELELQREKMMQKIIAKGKEKNIQDTTESGADWIGHIPKDWKIEKIGQHFVNRSEKVSDRDFPPLSVTKNGIVPQLDSAVKTSANDSRKLVKRDDFVINSRSDRKQSCGLSEMDGSVSLINIILKPGESKDILPGYTKYLLKNYGFAEEFYRWGTGIASDLWSTKWDHMKKIPIPVPSIEKQQQIASRLNEFEVLVSLENEIRDTLLQYKKSLIYEVVTGKKEV